LEQRQSDLENILLERIRDREHADIYTGMLEKCETDIKSFKKQLEDFRDFDTTIRKRKAEMKQNIDLIDEIVAVGAISNAHLRMLVDCLCRHRNKHIEEHRKNLRACNHTSFAHHLKAEKDKF
jgi:hypothetical protein